MAKFGKGNKVGKGRPKNAKNKTTLLLKSIVSKEITEEEKLKLFRATFLAAFKLVKHNNVTIINTLLNKMFPNAETTKNDNGDIEVPVNINDLSDQQANELYEKLMAKKC